MHSSMVLALILILLTPTLSHAQKSPAGKGGIVATHPPCASYTQIDFHGAKVGFGQYCDSQDNPTILEMQISYKGGFVYAVNKDKHDQFDDLPENPPYAPLANLTARWERGLSPADQIRIERVLLPALECGDGPVIRKTMQELIQAPWDQPASEVKLTQN